MQSFKVSIIIPVYKVEPYIERCIDSVLHQTYRNLEVILVDDCSPDHSMEIAREHIEASVLSKDLQFIYLNHDHNRGLSAARNTGIYAATGEYIYFLDSDDYILNDCIRLFLVALENNSGVEMIVGEITQIGKNFPWHDFYLPGIHSTDIIELACSYRIYTMAWNKLIKKDFLVQNNLLFKEGLYHEDELWNFQLACKLHSMCFIPQKTYYYVIHEKSIQSNPSYKFHYINNVNVKLEMIQFVFDNNLYQNETIYRFITSNIYSYLIEPRQRNERMASYYFYKKWRQRPYWPLGFVISHCTNRKDKLRALHRFMPVPLGMLYLLFIEKLN